MKIVGFEISGFRNLSHVSTSDLGSYEVLHGPNNVGKSNIADALELAFALMADVAAHPGRSYPTPLAPQYIEAAFWKLLRWSEDGSIEAADVFRLDAPSPARVELRVRLESNEQRALSIRTTRANGRPAPSTLRLVVQLHPTIHGIAWDLEWTADKVEDPQNAVAHEALDHWVVGRLGSASGGSRALRVFEPRRWSAGEPSWQEIALAAYDHKEGTSGEHLRRWDAFERAARAFDEVLGDVGPGRWTITYDRALSRAEVFRLDRRGRRALHRLGAGIQSAIATLAAVAFSDATILALEEPELGLSIPLQQPLAEALRLLAAEAGVQILISSHSPYFVGENSFLWVTQGKNGPQIDRAPSSRVWEATATPTDRPEGPTLRSDSLVRPDGMVRLPRHVRERLSVEQGGSVLFFDAPGTDREVRVLNTADALVEVGDDEVAAGG